MCRRPTLSAPWLSRSASARFTETRVAPTNAATSSCVISISLFPCAVEMSRRHFATRPETSRKTRSSMRPEARRIIRASRASSSFIAFGFRSMTRRKSSRDRARTCVSLIAVTVADRGASSKSASWPKMPPPRSIAITTSCPLSSGIATFTVPATITYMCAAGSSRWNTTSSRAKRRARMCVAASTRSGWLSAANTGTSASRSATTLVSTASERYARLAKGPRPSPYLRSATGRVRVVGHRGAAAHAPENTIASLELGVREGADDVEFDVQRTADGVPVLLHDETCDRTTDGSGPLRERTSAAVSALDAGSWFGPSFAGERVPTLAAVCEWAGRNAAGLSVELKQPAPGEGLPVDDGLAAAVIGLRREPREGWLERDGTRLHYLEWLVEGPPPPRTPEAPLFLLHGLSSNARFWTRFAGRFPRRRVIALDQRSHGLSDPARGSDTTATF